MASVKNFLERIQFKTWIQKALVSGLVGLCIGGIFAFLFWALTAYSFARRQYDVNNLYADPSIAKEVVEGSEDFKGFLALYIDELQDLQQGLAEFYGNGAAAILFISAIEGVIVGLIIDSFIPGKGRIIGGMLGGFLAALTVGLLGFTIAMVS